MDARQASRINGGNSVTGRRASDFYPTPPEATIALMQFLNLPIGMRIWEPACGQGHMVRYPDGRRFFDLCSEGV